jgi:hypothetical protein
VVERERGLVLAVKGIQRVRRRRLALDAQDLRAKELRRRKGKKIDEG